MRRTGRKQFLITRQLAALLDPTENQRPVAESPQKIEQPDMQPAEVKPVIVQPVVPMPVLLPDVKPTLSSKEEPQTSTTTVGSASPPDNAELEAKADDAPQEKPEQVAERNPIQLLHDECIAFIREADTTSMNFLQQVDQLNNKIEELEKAIEKLRESQHPIAVYRSFLAPLVAWMQDWQSMKSTLPDQAEQIDANIDMLAQIVEAECGAYGVSRYHTEDNALFDRERMEAVDVVDTTDPACCDRIICSLSDGWTLGDKPTFVEKVRAHRYVST